MRRSSTCVDDFRDHVGGRPARSALTGAISIAIQLSHSPMTFVMPPELTNGTFANGRFLVQ